MKESLFWKNATILAYDLINLLYTLIKMFIAFLLSIPFISIITFLSIFNSNGKFDDMVGILKRLTENKTD